ncbi:MAG: hypothetical protein VB835_12490 [Pirellulales bacterium]
MKRFTQWTLTLTLAAQVVIGLAGTVHAQNKSYNTSAVDGGGGPDEAQGVDYNTTRSNTSTFAVNGGGGPNKAQGGDYHTTRSNTTTFSTSGRTQTIYYFAKEVKAGALNDIPAGKGWSKLEDTRERMTKAEDHLADEPGSRIVVYYVNRALRNDVMKFISQLKKMPLKKQAAFLAEVKRANSLRTINDRQTALTHLLNKFGGRNLLNNANKAVGRVLLVIL